MPAAGNEPFRLSRTLDAPRQLVWDSWTQEEHLRKWFGPQGTRIVKCSMDLRPGGIFHYGMEGMGGGSDTFTTRSRFALAIDKVKPNGVAQGIVYVESFDVLNGAGQRIAGLENMPRAALSSPVDIDAKGNFRFKQIVYVVKEADGTTLLVSGRNTGFGTEASASNGEEKVTVWAEFDPKTGALKGGAKTEKLQKPKRTVAVRQDAQHIDVLPAKFLELLKLPDGDAQTGQHFTFDLMGTSTTVTVQEATAQRARIQVGSKMTVAKTMATGSAMAAAPAEAAAEDDALGEPPPFGRDAVEQGFRFLGGVRFLSVRPL